MIAFLRGDDKIEDTAIQIAQHLRVFAKFDDHVKRQRRQVRFQRKLKGFKTHADANRRHIFFGAFVEVALGIL